MKLNRRVKNAIANTAMENIAGALARYLASLSPETARRILSAKDKLLSSVIPGEFLGSLAGGAGGLAIAEVLTRFVPGFSDESADMVQDFVGMVADEYEEAISKKQSDDVSVHSTERKGVVMPKRQWYYNRNDKVAASGDCPDGHHQGDNGKILAGWRPVSFSSIIEANIPVPAGSVGCSCKIDYDHERAKSETPQAPSSEASKKPEDVPLAPRSFADFLGEALGSNDPIVAEKAKRLQALVAASRLTMIEIGLLEYCDSSNEFRLLLECTTPEELRSKLPLLQAKAERGFTDNLGNVVKLGGARVVEAVGKYRDGAKERGKRQTDLLSLARFCASYGTTREEVFWVIKAIAPTELNSIDELNETLVLYAVEAEPGGVAPLEVYREKRKRQKQQQPDKPEGGRIGRFLRRLRRG